MPWREGSEGGPLAAYLYGREVHPEEPRGLGGRAGAGPQRGDAAEKEARPPAADLEKFTKAVDGVFEQAMRSRKSDPGHVTIRRLNRAEYNNTVRDLIGVDFQPA